jgi:RNA polymerase sigma-70 factor, ECF subfamily
VRSAVVFCTRAEFRRGFRRVEAPIEEAAQVPATDVDPAEALARDGEGQVVRRLLAELPVERDREILRRHYLSEESKDSVCHALGIDDAHFRRVLHRAKQRLRELLEAAGLP